MTPKHGPEIARAKVNLFLHVTGKRADGYHLLESLVVFPDFGDKITVSEGAKQANGPRLDISGPFAPALVPAQDNLVVQAAKLFATRPQALAIALEKTLPVAAGIGGGSADAAAILRVLAKMEGRMPSQALLVSLGADVPMCMAQKPAFVSGIGDEISVVGEMPTCAIVLVNPGVAVPTGPVFAARNGPFSTGMNTRPEGFASLDALVGFLKECGNDLQTPATAIAPHINDALRQIQTTPNCLLARMSGSGATCFGLFADLQTAKTAADHIKAAHPKWWVQAAKLSHTP